MYRKNKHKKRTQLDDETVMQLSHFTPTYAKLWNCILYHDPLPSDSYLFALCLEWINGIYNTIHSRHFRDKLCGVL